jgi:uncharacterized protein (AIM24 family)
MQGGSRYRTAADATEDFLFHLYRGSELLQDNRVHEAKAELERALELSPRDAKGQDLLAVVYFRLGIYTRAIEIYEELVRAFPGDPTLSQNLGLCYLKTGQADKARTLLETVVMAQPDNLRAWGYVGLVHERLGDYDKARVAFERGQQPGMARRMDDLIAKATPPRSLSVPPPSASSGAFVELEAPMPTVDPAPLMPVAAQPANAPALPNPPSALPSLADLAQGHALALPKGTRAARDRSGLLVVQVETSFASRIWAVRAMISDAQGLRAAPLARRARGRMLEEPLGGVDQPIVSLSGTGTLALAPHDEHELVALALEEEPIYVREHALIGFEGGMTYENGRLSTSDGHSVPLVQIRGRGLVVFELRHAIRVLEVNGDAVVVAPESAIVGWTGRLIPRELGADEAPGGAKGLFAFSGEGRVIVSASTVAPVGAHP